MSARRTRRLVSAGSLSLALALTAPAAAFADHREEHDPKGAPSEQGEDARSGSGSAEGEDRRGSAEGEGRRGSAGESNDEPNRSSGRSDDGRAAGGDPRGNNGTIKIDGEAFDDGRGNEPHVGCVFELDFYGFDAGDTATITFTGHAPTGGGQLHTQRATISTDAAGGGQDRDATLRYSVSDQLRELLDVAPHPKQGWHVKVAVDVDSAPGGAKQKVFWIDCPQSAVGSGSTGSGSTGSGSTDSATAVSGTTSEAATGGGSDVTVTKQSLPQAGTFGSGTFGVAAAADNRVEISAQSVAARGETSVGAAAVSARGAVRPSALPFTGAQGMVALLALGLGTLGVGAVVQRLGRRSAADLG